MCNKYIHTSVRCRFISLIDSLADIATDQSINPPTATLTVKTVWWPQQLKVPKDATLADLWNLTSSIKADTESLCQSLNGGKERLDDIEKENKEYTANVWKNFTAACQQWEITSVLLAGLAVWWDKEREIELWDLKAHSMWSNLITHGQMFSKESSGEDCLQL